jgi:hypothetical protein
LCLRTSLGPLLWRRAELDVATFWDMKSSLVGLHRHLLQNDGVIHRQIVEHMQEGI